MAFEYLKVLIYNSTGNECNTYGGSDPGSPCLFPFMSGEITYEGCTTVENGGVPWCATAYRSNSIIAIGWSNCYPGCPNASMS